MGAKNQGIYIKRLRGIMTPKEKRKQVAALVKKVFDSRQGQKAFSEASQCATKTVSRLRKARYVDPERLKRPTTV